MTSSEATYALPESAYVERPYANHNMIYKDVQVRGHNATFVIDPWTQRWAILDRAAVEVLKLADGRRRLATIIRTLAERTDVAQPPVPYIDVMAELIQTQLVFANKSEHEAQGLPVYNKAPLSGLHLEITNACNMTCTHCYVSSGTKMPGELTLDQVRATIDMLPPFTGRRIAISGGEPVVRRDLLSIVEYAVRDCGHGVDLYTNGWKFPKRVAERLVELNRDYGDLIRIQVSLEGATAATNDSVRGRGSFDQAMKSLEMFRQTGLNRSTVIFTCVTKHNIAELDAVITLAEQLDVAMLVFSQWQRQGNASDTPWASIAPTLEEWTAAGERILQYRNPRLQVFGNFYGDLNNNEYGRYSLDRPLFPKHIYMYNTFPRVAPNGDVWADQLWVDPDWILGNVATGNLEDCFDTPKFYDQLSQMKARVKNVESCQSCEWRELCQGGSPGHTYAEYGHMNAKDLFCDSRIYWFNRFVDHQIKVAEGRMDLSGGGAQR